MLRLKKKTHLSNLMSHLDTRYFNQNFKKVSICTGDPKLKKKNDVHKFSRFFSCGLRISGWLVLLIAHLLSLAFFLLINLEISIKFTLKPSCTREGAIFYSKERGGFENARKVVRCLGTVLLSNLTHISKYFVLLLFGHKLKSL